MGDAELYLRISAASREHQQARAESIRLFDLCADATQIVVECRGYAHFYLLACLLISGFSGTLAWWLVGVIALVLFPATTRAMKKIPRRFYDRAEEQKRRMEALHDEIESLRDRIRSSSGSIPGERAASRN